MTDSMKQHIFELLEKSLGPGERPFTVHIPHEPIPDGEEIAIAVFPAATWNDLVSTYMKAKGLS